MLTIPDGVYYIDECAFSGMGTLQNVSLPNTLRKIGFAAFNWDNLSSIIIPSSVTEIDGEAFRLNQITTVTIPNSSAVVNSTAFDPSVKVVR